MIFTPEEWAEHMKLTWDGSERARFYYERDHRIGEIILNEGLEGVIRLLKSEIFPENAGYLSFLVADIYDLLKKKGLV